MTSPWLVTGLVERSRTRTTKEMTTMKGFKTLGFALLVAIGGVLQMFDWATVIPQDKTWSGMAMIAVGAGIAALRAVTSTPIATSALVALALGMSLLSPSPSFAADMQPVPVVRKAVTAAPVQSWSGFYFGINGSGAKMSGKAAIPGDVAAVNPAGAMAGVMAGYGGWLASGAYVGLEAMGDYDFSQANTCLIIDCKIKSGANLSQRLVVGMTLPQIMSKAQARGVSSPSQWPVPLSLPADFSASAAIPYLAVGLAERQTQACAIDCERKWLLGWQVGGGIKAPTSSGVTLDVGYAYTNWMKNRQFDVGVPVDIKATGEHKMTAGVQFHL